MKNRFVRDERLSQEEHSQGHTKEGDQGEMREDQPELRRLQELKDFLVTRRKRLAPEQIGLPPGEKRRTPGLRRAEVAQLAGMGSEYQRYGTQR